MKQILFMLMAFWVLSCNAQNTMPDSTFKAQRILKTASINLNANLEKVFPLFGAFEERKWADGWSPQLVYPATETMDEGTTFKTHGHGHQEQGFLWIVAKYQPQDHLVQYLVSTENRFWTITIKCAATGTASTIAEVTYCYTGLNEMGNEINPLMLQSIYKYDLKDWQKAINYYLETGRTLKE